ncbi:hypothetical protein Dda_3704 [Drechslerella dactyloides]|uniref:Uncharacterized protein n=1 Tax=Drechslerella dactyloides TaxID=74499 RepID=A0AAD6NJS6_DREDA|nr:hypothetical protein Dda_3704 [Drechslerella dactyloides]
MREPWKPQLPLFWLLFPSLVSIVVEAAEAGAAIKLNQANETSAVEDLSEVAVEALGDVSAVPTYISYITTVEVVTAPTVTITSFVNGPSIDIPARTASTAATSPMPTGMCNVPREGAAPCILSSNGTCIREYYDALRNCYKAGTFPTAKNLAQYFIDCQGELGDSGSFDSFRSCSLMHAKQQQGGPGALQKRSTLRLNGAVVITDDEFSDALDSAGIIMMDESEIWDLEHGSDDEFRHPPPL